MGTAITPPRQKNGNATHTFREPWPAATSVPDPQPLVICMPMPKTAAPTINEAPISETNRP